MAHIARPVVEERAEVKRHRRCAGQNRRRLVAGAGVEHSGGAGGARRGPAAPRAWKPAAGCGQAAARPGRQSRPRRVSENQNACCVGLVEGQGRNAVSRTDLADLYRDYIACLNKQDWPILGRFVHDEVHHNCRRIRLAGYREMLERDFLEIPDLHFNIQLLISDPPYVASSCLEFDCSPEGRIPAVCKNVREFLLLRMYFMNLRMKRLNMYGQL